MSSTEPRQAIRLYRYPLSGHCHRVHAFLDPFVNIRAWLSRVEALPGFVPMPHSR